VLSEELLTIRISPRIPLASSPSIAHWMNRPIVSSSLQAGMTMETSGLGSSRSGRYSLNSESRGTVSGFDRVEVDGTLTLFYRRARLGAVDNFPARRSLEAGGILTSGTLYFKSGAKLNSSNTRIYEGGSACSSTKCSMDRPHDVSVWEWRLSTEIRAMAEHSLETMREVCRPAEHWNPAESTRTQSFGQDYQPTLVDRFGVWLSSRQIRRHVADWRGKRIADFGCGFHAAFARTLLDQVEHALLADVSISANLHQHPRVTALEGPIPEMLPDLSARSFDVILCISVLEHLWEPGEALSQFRRLLAPGGFCLLNVPSWRGKRFLEYSAFQIGMSPAEEMNDHKCYYDVSDLWPLLVRAGFRPSNIKCFSHKFGLNTFAVCGVAE